MRFKACMENSRVKPLNKPLSYKITETCLPFKPKDQTLNSHLLPLFISHRSSGKKLTKYQANSSCVIMSLILMTTLFYKALILQGEI